MPFLSSNNHGDLNGASKTLVGLDHEPPMSALHCEVKKPRLSEAVVWHRSTGTDGTFLVQLSSRQSSPASFFVRFAIAAEHK